MKLRILSIISVCFNFCTFFLLFVVVVVATPKVSCAHVWTCTREGERERGEREREFYR